MVINTSVFIAYLRTADKRNTLFYKLPSNISYSISTVTLFELYMGANNSEKEQDILLLTKGINVLHFDEAIARKAGEIFRLLKRQNSLIEFRDIFIAATCIVNNLPVITLNKKHFARINDLKLYPTG